MATWTPESRNSASFTPESRNSATFSNTSKSDVGVFDDLPLSTIEAETFNGVFRGKAIDDWKFNDPVVLTVWQNQTRN